ncbi:MAG: KH domain-containing protein [Clostridia bacterium]|nr:KH domain-containing protein [Clostridia bacterium]
MDKTYVFEGKTTNEAIDNGLKELKVSKNKVDIKVLESEEKRSFFSILTPRVVKVEITLKEDVESEEKRSNVEHKEIKNQLEFNKSEVQERIQKFLDDFIKNLPQNDLNYKIDIVENDFHIDVEGEDTGYLIGYRGEVLNSLQLILTNIASKNLNCKVKVLLNIGGYREKRQKDLENLALKIAGSVIKSRKSITLEPMSAYERKIIHLKLQDNEKVQTHSIGEEPYRKIVVSLKSKYKEK